MPSLAHLSFAGGCSAEAQLIDVNPVSQLTQLRHFSLDDVPHTLDYSCLSNLTSLTHLVLSEPSRQPRPQHNGQQQQQQQLEFEAQQFEKMGKALSVLSGLVELHLPCIPAADALSSLTALTDLAIGLHRERHSRHGWGQHITGEPLVLPNIRSIDLVWVANHTDHLLSFLAGTHMPNVVEVRSKEALIVIDDSGPWWKEALVRAATGFLHKCSTVQLDWRTCQRRPLERQQ
jgi:hypothetical protein